MTYYTAYPIIQGQRGSVTNVTLPCGCRVEYISSPDRATVQNVIQACEKHK